MTEANDSAEHPPRASGFLVGLRSCSRTPRASPIPTTRLVQMNWLARTMRRSASSCVVLAALIGCRPAPRASAASPESPVETATELGKRLAPGSPSTPVRKADHPLPVGIYSPLAEDLPGLAEAKFTLLGPTYHMDDAELLELAGTADMGAIYSVGLTRAQLDSLVAEGQLSESNIRRIIGDQVDRVDARTEVSWWCLQPDELRFWYSNEMDYLRVATETIRAHDTRKRPILHYSPTHWNSAALAHVLPYLDFAAKGSYANHSGHRDRRIWVRWSIEQELKAIQSTGSLATPLAVVEMFAQPADESQISSWVRHDVYLALLTGARGILVYSGARRAGFDAREAYLAEYSRVADELNGAKRLGPMLLTAEPTHDISVAVVDGPTTLVLPEPGFAGEVNVYPALTSRELVWQGRRYLFLVNSANRSLRIRLRGLPRNSSLEDAFDVLPRLYYRGETTVLDLHPLGVRVLEFGATH